jgi:hypothetical protein
MEIRTYTVADLEGLLASEAFWRTETLPITRHKAESFRRNPRARREDPVLLVAERGGRVDGYLGILPDTIFFDDAAHRLGWLTGWWVDPGTAVKGLGAILLFKALNLYPGGLGVSGGSREARRVLDGSRKFVALPPLQGLELRLRFDATRSAPARSPALKPCRVVFRLADLLLDEILKRRRPAWERRNPVLQRPSCEHISTIDAETRGFIERHHRRDLTRKGKADFDWIMTSPWVLSAPQKDAVGRRHYFSSACARFAYLGLKVFDPGGRMAGFVLLGVRDERMRVLFAYYDRSDAAVVAAAIVRYALAVDARCLRLYDDHLAGPVARLRPPGWSTRSISEEFFLSRALERAAAAGRRLQGGDGDLAFY